jgi:ABC-type branched-subunit amino acid transport system substrate-binding protein
MGTAFAPQNCLFSRVSSSFFRIRSRQLLLLTYRPLIALNTHLGGFRLSTLRSGSIARLTVFALATLMLAACASGGNNTPPPLTQRPNETPIGITPPPAANLDRNLFLRPPHMSDREPVRIAVLLPLSARQASVRSVADSLLNAAQLALFEFGNPNVLLIPKDTRGTNSGAEGAAREALQEGAELILGPLFSGSVTAVRPIAAQRNVPVIAFSSDSSVAGNGVYLLSFLPEQDVDRVVDFAGLKGLTVFAGMVPQNDYGSLMRQALTNAVTSRAGEVYRIESYPNRAEAMFEPARRLALYDERKRALASEKARLQGVDSDEARAALKSLEGRETLGDVPYQAVFVPAGGTELRSVAPLLPYFDVDPRKVRFLGTGQWDDASLGREPSLVGAWFAAPPRDAHNAFSQRYARAFGSQPPRMASLGYDATSLASALAARPPSQRFNEQILGNPDGFAGVDGIFRFLPDGRNERGLAVLEMRRNGPVVVDPAPQSFVPAPTF